MTRLALLTSGGDAPGMNAAIRAVVRSGVFYKKQIVGILRGYEGMIDGDFIDMDASSVSNILQRGGTILKTARSKNFPTEPGMKAAFVNLNKNKIDGVVAIGGDGTFRGANEFSKKYKIPFVGIPGTIDNDLFGTDYCIGYDTAINTVVQAVDKIRDTAESHDRLFLVEVMGRDAGLIALRSGIGVGAEAILIPETKTNISRLIRILKQAGKRKKSSNIIIIAEGDEAGGAVELAKILKEKLGNFDTRVSILGHMQRGGSPTAADRVLASRLGVAAVEALIMGRHNVMVGVVHKDITHIPFSKATKHITTLNKDLLHIAEMLSL